ncbi:MAG TPA: hypothetical protein VF008_14935 [Niastella sp.]
MKRNETPLNASIFLDAICSPFILTGNYALLAQSPPWLLKNYSGNTKTSVLFNHFIPAHQNLPGYNNMIENIRAVKNLCLRKNPLNKKYNNIKTDNRTTDIITYR